MDINFEKLNAKRLLNNTFLFNDPWAMEATHIPYSFENEIDWNVNPFGDPEWTFMLARCDYVLKLTQVGEYTNLYEYLNKAKELIFDFIENAKCVEENYITSWRSLDAGIRVKNWLKAYEILYRHNLLDIKEQQIFRNSIIEHTSYLSKIDTPFTKLSNWGIIADSGLYCASLFLENKQFINLSISRIIEQINYQIFDDGFHWEQSPMYHVEVLISIFDIIEESRKYKIILDQKILDTASLMSYAIIKSQKPNHHQIMQNDSDDTDIRDILSRATLLLKDGVIKYFSNKSLSYPFSEKQIKEYETIKIEKPTFTSAVLNESGNYYLRSGWEETDSLIHFFCGSLGSGHGHSSLLHFDFAYGNEDIFVDSGRYTYTECKERYQLKSTALHNSIMIDNIDYFTVKDSWAYEKKGTFIKSNYIEKGSYKYINGFNTSYLAINGSLIERKILSLNKDLFIIFDVITTKSKHKINRYFHFDNNANLVIENDNIIKYIKEKLNVYVYFERDCIIKEETSLYSKHYNKLETKPSLNIENNIEGNTSFITVVNVNNSKIEVKEEKVKSMRFNTLFKKEDIRAFTINDEKNGSYEVLFTLNQCHEGVDLFKANKLCSFGKTLVFHNNKLTKIEL